MKPPKETATADRPRRAPDHDRGVVREVATADLMPSEVSTIRRILVDAFGSSGAGFTEDDWEHALGGTHFLLELDGALVGHASVVERNLRVDATPLRTGYVEAVAVAPDLQAAGLGSRLMEAVTSHVRKRFELGALGTGRHRFYERLGWLIWAGPTAVRTATGTHRTPDEDGDILVLPTPSSPRLDLTAPISCDWRPGDVW